LGPSFSSVIDAFCLILTVIFTVLSANEEERKLLLRKMKSVAFTTVFNAIF